MSSAELRHIALLRQGFFMPLPNALKLTCKLLLLSVRFAISEPVMRVHADSTMARCLLSDQNLSLPVESGPCRFSQRQGNVTIMFRERTFNFPDKDAGLRYQRSNRKTGIRFDMPGGSTVEVFWR